MPAAAAMGAGVLAGTSASGDEKRVDCISFEHGRADPVIGQT